MTTPIVQTRGEATVQGKTGKVREETETMLPTEIPQVLIPIFTDSLLFKLASCISALYVRLFGRSVPDCNAVERLDSDYLSYGSCCF